MKGLAPTPTYLPNGDAKVVAKCKQGKRRKVVASCTVLVVIPVRQSHGTATPQIANGATLVAGGILLQTDLYATVNIMIVDQFLVALDSVYDSKPGELVVWEIFDPIYNTWNSNVPGLGNWVPIDSTLSSGAAVDYVVITFKGAVAGNFGPADENLWESGNAFPGIQFDNLALVGNVTGFDAVQSISVDSGGVTPSYRRLQRSKKAGYSPPPFEFTEQ